MEEVSTTMNQLSDYIYTCTSPLNTVIFSNMFSSVEWAKEQSQKTNSRIFIRRSSIDSGEDIFQNTFLEIIENKH